MKFALDYVSAFGKPGTIVVESDSPDAAYNAAQVELAVRGMHSAALQGTCRRATQEDIDLASDW